MNEIIEEVSLSLTLEETEKIILKIFEKNNISKISDTSYLVDNSRIKARFKINQIDLIEENGLTTISSKLELKKNAGLNILLMVMAILFLIIGIGFLVVFIYLTFFVQFISGIMLFLTALLAFIELLAAIRLIIFVFPTKKQANKMIKKQFKALYLNRFISLGKIIKNQ